MGFSHRCILLTAGLILSAPPARGDGPIFYPPLPETPRLQFLKSYSTLRDLGQSQNWLIRALFGPEKENSLVDRPYGIAAQKDRIYVCDTQRADVRILDLERREARWLIGRSRGVKLKKPINIAIDGLGFKFIADTGLRRVVAFDVQDRFWRSYQDDEDWQPVDVAPYGPYLYVLDIKNHRIKVFDRASGRRIRVIGATGSGEGQLFMPTNLAVDGDGNLYVSDTLNFRIEKFSSEGTLLKSYGEIGQAPGAFTRPKGIAVDREGRIYAVDAAFENVQIFDDKGQVLLFFGESGNDAGQMNLPAKVALDYDPGNLQRFQALADPRLKLSYLVWVTNQYGPQRVSVYGFGRWQERAGVP